MEKKKTEYTIKTSVEVEGLDCAIEKAKQFVALMKKAAEIQAKEGWMMDNKIYFLCDGEKEDCRIIHCYKNTDDPICVCRHTTDITHAKNFERRKTGNYMEKPQHMKSAAAEKIKKQKYIPPKRWDTSATVYLIKTISLKK